MLVKIAVVVSVCSHIAMTNVQKRVAELQAQNPKAQVTVRLDKKCTQAVQGFEEQ